MKIGILGTGVVGQTLGAGFAALGHEVKMGSREPGSERVQDWVARTGALSSAGTFGETAAWADLAVLATGWDGTNNAIYLADPKNLAGKVVIDVTNPLARTPEGMPTLALGFNDSGGEQVQRWLPEAKVVKAFNIIGAPHMVNPDFPGGPPDMFICGNDTEAMTQVKDICERFGWHVVDTGGIEGARLLEPMAILWVLQGIRTGRWDNAFRLLTK
jgi:predicted dinucleotide-binding enzyme